MVKELIVSMSFLSDTRLEIKSLYDSNLVHLGSYKQEANVHLVPEDSATHYSVITTASYSNMETHITLHSEDAEIEVVSFTSNSIHFGNDTLLRGNLVVFGSVYALGYDVLTHEEDKNNFILNNYGTSAEKGINSASEKTLGYLNNLSQTTSNAIISYILNGISNMEETLGISQLNTIQNNMFTINDFENLFAAKTLDDFKQGSSNNFIVNDATSNAITLDSLITSNIYSPITTSESIYASSFYGDATHIYNVNREHFNTNEIIETPSSSNLYFTYNRAGLIAYSSNTHISNYITDLYNAYYNNLFIKDSYASNFIFSFESNLLGNVQSQEYHLRQYLDDIANPYRSNFDVYYQHHLDYFTEASDTLNSLVEIQANNISNYIASTSNILFEATTFPKENVMDYAIITSNNLFNHLRLAAASQKTLIEQASNVSEFILASSNILSSNLIASTYTDLAFCITQSNIDIVRTMQTVSQKLTNHLQQSSNNTISYANAIKYTAANLSNYITSISSNTAVSVNTAYAFINQDVLRGIKEYSNLSLYSTSNEIKNLSNIVSVAKISFSNMMPIITTDNIPESTNLSNLYFTSNRFRNSLSNKTLDNLSQGSIINNKYNRDLIVQGNITAQKVIVQGDANFKKAVYNTERVVIENYSDIPAVTLFAANNQKTAIKVKDIFVFQYDSMIGIKTATPTVSVDVNGTMSGDYFVGSGKFLRNVNLKDRTTIHLQEGFASNLYFSSSRVSEILIASNIETSNFISDLVYKVYSSNLAVATSNIFAEKIFNNDIRCSNYYINATDALAKYIINTPDRHWTYAIGTSNKLQEYAYAFNAGHSNAILHRTLEIDANIKTGSWNISNYLEQTSNRLHALKIEKITSQCVSDVFATKMNDIILNHSNHIFSLSNLFASTYLTSYALSTKDGLLDRIDASATYYSNMMNMTSNDLVSLANMNVLSLLPYNAGDIYPYSHTYDANILHLNFKDKKILNGINSDYFRLISGNSNFTEIYPVINNFTTKSSLPNYSAMNQYAFNASPLTYIYVNRQIKKLTNIAIHFAFNVSNTGLASILTFEYMDVQISNSKLTFIKGNASFVSATPIVPNTWYIVDIILYDTTIDMYINLALQQLQTFTVNSLSYQQGIFIGKTQAPIKIQDLRIYNANDAILIHLYQGLNIPEYTITSNVIIKPVRWLESPNYSCNYFSPLGRYISCSCNVCIGKKDAAEATLDIYTDDPYIYSIKTNNPIWVQSALLTSSDARIKTNIRDMKPEEALRQVLAVEPKTYKYVDNTRTDKTVYGFSAQQIRAVIPSAVSLHTNSIPNINSIGRLHDKHFITLANATSISIPSTVVLYYNDNIYYEEVLSIISSTKIKIANKSGIPDCTILVYGTIVDDFHTLDKNYIYTLNVCATQDLYRQQEDLASNLYLISPDTHSASNIAELADHVKTLKSSMTTMKNTLGQIEYDLNYITQTSEAMNVSNYVSTFMNNLMASENNIQAVLEENMTIFNTFNHKIDDLSILQTDIDNMMAIFLKNNMK